MLFNKKSYVSFDKTLDGALFKDGSIIFVTLGLVPLQTIFNDYEISDKIERKKINISRKVIKEIIESKDYYLINNKEIDKSKINKEYIFEDNKKNEIKMIGNEFGKVEIYINNIYIKEYYDHKDIITYIHYNKRLNMFVTTSLDGYACIYSFPNKLLSVIKNPDNSYFDYALLGANPFPFILTYDIKKRQFKTYSLNGLFIHYGGTNTLIGKEVKVFPIIDTNGGLFNDAFLLSYDNAVSYIELPFLEKKFRESLEFINLNI